MYSFLSIKRCFTILLVLSALVITFPQGASAANHRRICTWAAIGPFTPTSGDGMNENLLSPAYTDLQASPSLGTTVNGKTWNLMDDRIFCRNHDDYNDFYTYYGIYLGQSVHNSVAYAGTYLYIPTSGIYTIHFGANEKAKVILNGQTVIAQTTASQAKRQAYTINTTFNSGWNRILVKVYNYRGPWGFYFNVTTTGGAKISGTELCPHTPQTSYLQILNDATMPKGYQHEPYVELDVTYSGSNPDENPSASPFRFTGTGGTPPYTFDLYGGSLPSSISLNTTEGEITTSSSSGRLATSDVGSYIFTIRMRDSSSPQKMTTKTFYMTVDWAPTSWMTVTGAPRIGGLRHAPNHFANPTEIAELIGRQGYDWCAPTGIKFRVDNDVVEIDRTTEITSFKNALNNEGVLMAAYVALDEQWDTYGSNGIVNFSGYIHEYVEQLIQDYEIPFFWLDNFDGSHRPSGVTTWELDALYSLIKSMDPNCLVLLNSEGGIGRDNGLGDIDIVSYHGHIGEKSGDTNNYWNNWPGQPMGNNPRYLPQDSFRYPQEGAMDYEEWLKSIITMMAETENFSAIRLYNFDHSCEVNDSLCNMHEAVAVWLEVGDRKKAIFNVEPGITTPADAGWGYSVRNRTSGDYYLHLISNSKGKTGFDSGDLTVYNLPSDYTVTRVSFAENTADNLIFSQNGTTLTIYNIPVSYNRDPVSTILWLEQ